MAEKPKRCMDCAYHWRDGTGYSDWTWMDTELRCALGLHPDWPASQESGTEDAQYAFAEKCDKFDDDSYKGPSPLVSPDGELSDGEGRAAGLIRLISQ